MKTFLAVCSVFAIIYKIFCIEVNYIPTLATNEIVPVLSNNVRLQMPYCYFDGISADCVVKKDCLVWIVSSLTSEKDKYSKDTVLYKYENAYTPTGSKMHTRFVSTLDKLPCPATEPYNLLVGSDTNPCFYGYCDGAFPEGRNMSFMYILTTYYSFVGQTKWSDNIPLKNRGSSDNVGSGGSSDGVERSAAMVVITTILSVLMGLIFLLLLTLLILGCLQSKGKHTFMQKDTKH